MQDKKINKAENVLKYYSSVFFANIFLCFILTFPIVLFIAFLPSLIDVPAELVNDVRALFLLVFLHFFIDILSGILVNSGYVLNRLDMVAMRKTEATVLKGVFTFAIFFIFVPHLWYVGLVQVICSLYNAFRNLQIHRKLMPEVKFSKKYFDIHKIAELVTSGIWNTISAVGTVLVSGLDVLITNVAINATAMDIVSVAKYIPIYVQSLVVTLANVFAPKQTKLFAENDFEGMKKTLVGSSRFVALITCLPVVFMVVYGKQFFTLWVPSKDAEVLWILATVAVAMYPIQLVASTYGAVISSANKVKLNSLVTIAFSLLSIGALFVLLQFTDSELLKMAIIVGSSSVFMTIQNLAFTVPYCSKIIQCKAGAFYWVFIQGILAIAVSGALCYLISTVFIADTWLKLICSGAIVCVIGAVVGFILILGKEEKTAVFTMIKKILKR